MINIKKRLRHSAVLIIRLLVAGFFFADMAAQTAYSSGKTTIYFFWSTGCRYCQDEKAFLAGLAKKYPELDIKSLEVRSSSENARLLSDMADAYGVRIKGVPATFIGGLGPVVGYQGEASTGRLIESRIKQCIESKCADPIERLGRQQASPWTAQGEFKCKPGQQGVCGQDAECPEEKKVQSAPPPEDRQITEKTEMPPLSDKKDSVINLPLIGELDISGDALFYQTIVIAGIDGFNPCAFFVLFTLLGLLVHVQSRKKPFLVGGTFVFFSGFIYFIFMAAWLNIFLLTGKIAAVTMAAGTIALFIALINIKDFFYFRKGVSLGIPYSAKPGLFLTACVNC